MNEFFRYLAEKTAKVVGSPWAFVAAVGIVFIWGVSGPIFRFSDTWQLVINTGTTIVTFLIVFLIQNTQNRDSRIAHLKLDELLRSVEGARTSFVSLDKMTDAELDEIQKEFERLRLKYAPLVDDDLETIKNERARRASKKSKPGKG
ncbi:MAG: low affinity iron permease family protein [Rhodomicrobium sp.]